MSRMSRIEIEIEGVNLHGILHLACDENNIEPVNRSRTVEILSRHIDNALQTQRDYGHKSTSIFWWIGVRLGKYYGAYVSALYCFVKLLYVCNAIAQFFVLNRFLETDGFPNFGAQVFWRLLHGMEWPESGKFPRVTLCDFQIRVLGNFIQLNTFSFITDIYYQQTTFTNILSNVFLVSFSFFFNSLRTNSTSNTYYIHQIAQFLWLYPQQHDLWLKEGCISLKHSLHILNLHFLHIISQCWKTTASISEASQI